jgi:hypothetical protein
MDTRRQKAFDLSIDSAKLLIILAAAILTLTLTLATDVSERLVLLKGAWVLYFLSILVGVGDCRRCCGNGARCGR